MKFVSLEPRLVLEHLDLCNVHVHSSNGHKMLNFNTSENCSHLIYETKYPK
jgi:hypothetical protein